MDKEKVVTWALVWCNLFGIVNVALQCMLEVHYLENIVILFKDNNKIEECANDDV